MSGAILAIDSSTAVGSAAVGDASGVFAESILRVAGGHSAALLPAIDQVLRTAGISRGDLTGVVVGSGPGSFTGVRIAGATAKGIIQGLSIPLFAYSGLLATATCGWGVDGMVCALFDARRRDVYAACYRFRVEKDSGKSVLETELHQTALSMDELIDRFAGSPPPLFVGEGAQLHESELQSRLGARVIPEHLGIPRASALIWLATRFPELGRVADSSAWEPDYIRASGAERIAEAARVRSGIGP